MYTDGQKNATCNIFDEQLKHSCILAYMPDKQKSINSNNRCFTQASGHGKPVQLVFVNHMSNLTKFYLV